MPKFSSQIPIVFLDFDGVLNHELFYKNADKKGRGLLDPMSVQILNELTKIENVKVVVSSTYRLSNTTDQLQYILDAFGFVGEVIGKTPSINCNGILRGNEIISWIKDHPIECGGMPYYDYDRYVILDDDSDMLYWQRNNFIHIDRYCGITPTNIFKAKKILQIK